MARRSDRKRMTLSEHLALRAQAAERAAEEEQAQEEARLHTMRNLRELDAQVMCTCPACVRLRQMNGRSSV